MAVVVRAENVELLFCTRPRRESGSDGGRDGYGRAAPCDELEREKDCGHLPRLFRHSNGAEKHITVQAPRADWMVASREKAGTACGANSPAPAAEPQAPQSAAYAADDFAGRMRALAGNLNICSRRGLSERL